MTPMGSVPCHEEPTITPVLTDVGHTLTGSRRPTVAHGRKPEPPAPVQCHRQQNHLLIVLPLSVVLCVDSQPKSVYLLQVSATA